MEPSVLPLHCVQEALICVATIVSIRISILLCLLIFMFIFYLEGSESSYRKLSIDYVFIQNP